MKEYNVTIEIKGTASTIVRANTPQEAKEIALKDPTFGDNDYFWWFDEKNPTIAVSEEEMTNPETMDINTLRNKKEWKFI